MKFEIMNGQKIVRVIELKDHRYVGAMGPTDMFDLAKNHRRCDRMCERLLKLGCSLGWAALPHPHYAGGCIRAHKFG